MSEEFKPYSVHSFMLPLRWDYLPKGYSQEEGKEKFTFDERTDLNKFLECLISKDSHWQRKFFRIEGKAKNFNEFHYFHAYASMTMFDLQQKDEKTWRDINQNKVMIYFELETNPLTDTYCIKTLDQEYKLALSGISLHVYNTGVAILTINVENHNWDSVDDILKINEYGRRIYPQFLEDQYPHTSKVKAKFLSDSIKISIAGFGDFADDFSEYSLINEREVHYYDGNEFKKSYVVSAPKYIKGLFNDRFCFIQKHEAQEKVRFNILTDDRMFFQSWYGSTSFSRELKSKKRRGHRLRREFGEYEYPYIKNKQWYSYIFGDKGGPSIANNEMQYEHIKKHSYTRWVDYGTLFGFTRDSFVSVSSPVPDLVKEDAPDLREHMKTMYYQMAVLSLAQRAGVLRFSAEVSILSDLAREDKHSQLLKEIKTLYKNYIEFINKVYYREITPYIQGIEMYDKFKEVMNIDQSVRDLDNELGELFNYVRLEEDEKRTKEATMLNWIAATFLPASLVAGILGMNVTGAWKLTKLGSPHIELLAAIGVCLATSLLFLLSLYFFKNLKKWKQAKF